MTELPVVARHVEEVTPDVLHWRIENALIGGEWSSAYAVRSDDGYVLIDPVPLADEALDALGPVAAIVLTAATHQRSAWHCRRRFGVPVWLPQGSRETDEEPDELYDDGDVLPGGLLAIRTPGPELPHFSLLLDREPSVLFSPDLVMVARETGELVFVPPQFHDDPAETRRSVERSATLDFEILCLAHGPPVLDGRRALDELLARTA